MTGSWCVLGWPSDDLSDAVETSSSVAIPLVGRPSEDHSVQHVTQDFVDDARRDRHQHHVGTDLLPFVAIVVRQARVQAAVEVLGDARRQRLAASQVLGDAGWQGRGRADQLAVVAEDDTYPADIDARATQVDPHVFLLTLLTLVTLLALARWRAGEDRGGRQQRAEAQG
ncbi:conserved protein of unknown function [Ectopseudomonas oleovorans]|uniref:Uncharacterized protein n=1 Tax=Ectopseudomonas oleovorans TaxID=301 RepID=A0A653B8F8_ECTOL|nr:conserved protein of unknown function [Pseudomonas oleovorans]